MKQGKVMMFLAFIFCMGFSLSASAAVQTATATTETIAKEDVISKKDFRKQLRKQWKKVSKKIKDVKKTLKEKAENASNGQLLLLALVGLGLILVGALLNIGLLYSIGSLLVVIAIVWWILQVLGII